MIASVHIAHVGARGSLPAVLRRPPDRSTVPGLRQSQIGVCGILGKGIKAPPQLGRVTLLTLGRLRAKRAPAFFKASADDSSGGFHRQSAFIRFRPFEVRGHVDRRNALDETALAL